jgi:phosphopantetheine adenylyltransferase
MEGGIVRKKYHTKVIFAFGRFQPPTVGHAVIIDAISQMASDQDADGYIFVSSSQDYIKNPLSVEQKIKVLVKQHTGKPITFVDTTLYKCRTIFLIIDALKEKGYNDLTFIVGSDRVNDFQSTIGKYHPNVVVTSVGDQRNTDESNDPSSVSGTRLRRLAKKENINEFSKFVKFGSMTNSNVRTLFNQTRSGLRGGYKSNKRQTRRKLRTTMKKCLKTQY